MHEKSVVRGAVEIYLYFFVGGIGFILMKSK